MLLNFKESVLQLPSLGACYDQEKVQLMNGDSVVIKPMKVGEMRSMSALSGADTYKSYYGILSKVVSQPEKLPFDELLSDDINTILYAMRQVTYGDDYEVPFTCQNCEVRNKPTLKISEMDFKTSDEMDEFKTEGLEFQLGDDILTLHQGRLRDERLINQHMQTLRRKNLVKNDSVDKLYVRYAQFIDTINGDVMPIDDKLRYLDNLLPGQFEEIVDFIEANSIGLVPDVFLPCESCGFEQEARITINASFFRPNSKRS